MLISLNWLREYVDISATPAQLAEDLTMLGLNVESLEHRPNPFDALRIGRVLTCKRHPNADKLSVCTVDIGEDAPRHIVCGAPNVRAGLEVAVIPAGASLPDGTEIKKGKLRGELSEGMICSEIELGLGEDASGIMELDFDVPAGTPLSAKFGEEDWLLDIEVTPNRPDQLGVLGVAREVAALYDTPLRLPATALPAGGETSLAPVPVTVEDTAGCPRYIARRLTGVTVGPSPEWLQARLLALGLRPINNVVDITNYVLFETGHPLHAFDAARLAGGEIRVRRARQGERLVTLDEKTLELCAEDLVIADARDPVALAGVMGGDASKVTDSTRELVLESAVFDPRSVRGARRRYDLSTDSSYRFERGTAFSTAALASARATQLFVELAGAVAADRPDDVAAAAPPTRTVALRPARANALLGTTLTAEDMAALLARFGLEARVAGDALETAIPDTRPDLELEVDLIEEVARLHGYNAVPRENRVRNTLYGARSEDERRVERLHRALTRLGCREVLTSTFMDPRQLDLLRVPADDPRRRTVTVLNPLVSFNETLRTSLLPGLLDVLRTNFHRGQEELRLYQLGRVYLARDGEALPDEPLRLALLLTGHAAPAHYSLPAAPTTLADLRGLALALAEDAGLILDVDYGAADPCYVPGASFQLKAQGSVLGQGGLLRASVLGDLKPKREVYVLEIDRPLAGALRQARYAPLPAFPAAGRDLALLVPDGVAWEQVESLLRRAGGKLLEDLALFDIYRGKGLPEGRASYAVRLSFRSAEGTLTDKQVDKVQQRILGELNKALKVELRS